MTQTSKLDILLNFIKKGEGGKKATKELTGLSKAVADTNKKAKAFTLGQIAARVSIGALTLGAIKQLPQMIQLGFRYQNAQIALEAYTGSAQAATDITEAISAASGFAVSKMEAVANATRIVSLGLASNAEEAAEFTRVAVTLGATMGKDVQGAFEEFSLLLANESILRLDTYGISGAKVREEMAKLAAEFPELDRSVRFNNATMTIAAEKMEKLEAAGFQATSSIDRLGALFRDAKLGAAQFVADGLLPVTEGFFGIGDAAKASNLRLAEGVESFEEYEAAVDELADTFGKDFVSKFALETGKLTEAEFEAIIATRELAAANEELIVVEEKVILTQGGINELLQEQAFLSKALSLGIAGSLTKAYEKAEEGQVDFLETQKELQEAGAELDLRWQEINFEIQSLTASYNAGGAASEDYRIKTQSLTIKQKDLNKRFAEGKISSEKLRNETDKINTSQSKLDETFGGVETAIRELREEQEQYHPEMDELQKQWEGAKEKADELTRSLERVTAELIFQSAAADLDAQTSLLLARELGLVDEATFAVAQSAQALRIIYEETGQEASEFAADVGILADSVASLQDRDVTITVDTIQANVAISKLQQRWSSLGLTLSDAWANILVDIQSQIPDISGLNFQQGGQFTIPETGAFGDVNPVFFNAERGETVTITPRDGSPPGGGGGGPMIGTVNVGSDTDMSFLLNFLQKARR